MLKDASDLIGVLLAAGGPASFPARMVWPLHQALKELTEEAGRSGLDGALPRLSFAPSPETGWRAPQAESGLLELRRIGVLEVALAAGRPGTITVDSASLVTYRRELMRMAPPCTQLFQRAGRRWAALVATAEKTASSAPASSASGFAGSTPN